MTCRRALARALALGVEDRHQPEGQKMALAERRRHQRKMVQRMVDWCDAAEKTEQGHKAVEVDADGSEDIEGEESEIVQTGLCQYNKIHLLLLIVWVKKGTAPPHCI